MKIRIGDVVGFAIDFICEQAKKSHEFLRGSLSYNSPFQENPTKERIIRMMKPSKSAWIPSPDLKGVEFA